jgi:eukaryotic translation initiation factor 2C
MDVSGLKTNLLPPELCEILPSQPYRGKLYDEYAVEMSKCATIPPSVKAQAIEVQGLRELGLAPNSPTLTAFGVKVGREMATIPGRILNSPIPKYRQDTNSDFNADKASWNLKSVKFTKGATLEKWAVLLIHDGHDEFKGTNDPELINTLEDFQNTCKISGMKVKSRPVIAEVRVPKQDPTNDPMRSHAIKAIREQMAQSFKEKPKLLLVILSDGDRHIYSGLKRLCDVNADVGECVSSFRGGL